MAGGHYAFTIPTLLIESSSEQSGSMSWTQKMPNTAQLLRPFCVREAVRASVLDLCLLVSNLCLMTFDKSQNFTWILPVVGIIQGSPLEVLWCLLKMSLVQSMSRVSVLFLYVYFNETCRNLITFEKSVIL